MRRVQIDVPKLFQLWNSTLRNDQLAEALGVTRDHLSALRDRYGLPVRQHQCPKGNASHKPDPTEDEIAERAAAIRQNWSPEEEERRRSSSPYRAPCYAFGRNGAAFSHMDG